MVGAFKYLPAKKIYESGKNVKYNYPENAVIKLKGV